MVAAVPHLSSNWQLYCLHQHQSGSLA